MKQKQYLDLTNTEYKNNALVGLEIVSRPYRKGILALSLAIASLSLVIPDLGLMFFAAFKFLGKYG